MYLFWNFLNVKISETTCSNSCLMKLLKEQFLFLGYISEKNNEK